VRLSREHEHDHENPGSHDRELHRSKSDATRNGLRHDSSPLAGYRDLERGSGYQQAQPRIQAHVAYGQTHCSATTVQRIRVGRKGRWMTLRAHRSLRMATEGGAPDVLMGGTSDERTR